MAEQGQKREREKCPELFEQHTRARRGRGGYNWQLAYVCSPIFRPSGRRECAKEEGVEDRVQEETKASDGILREKRRRGGKKREETETKR